MSRPQISFASMSNPFRMPVPVIAHTCLPSVTGDGDDIFCLRSFMLPPPSGRCQSVFGPRRSTHHSDRLSPSATFRKIRSPQMMGVEPLQAGIGSFHAMFSVVDHFTGRFFSPLIPLSWGPRHCGQFSASAELPSDRSVSRLSPSFIGARILRRDGRWGGLSDARLPRSARSGPSACGCALIAVLPTVHERGGHTPLAAVIVLLIAVPATSLLSSLFAVHAIARPPSLAALRA